MADKALEELLVSSEVQKARDRLEDDEAAAERNPEDEEELSDLPPWSICRARCGCCWLPSIARRRASASRSTTNPQPALGHVWFRGQAVL